MCSSSDLSPPLAQFNPVITWLAIQLWCTLIILHHAVFATLYVYVLEKWCMNGYKPRNWIAIANTSSPSAPAPFPAWFEFIYFLKNHRSTFHNLLFPHNNVMIPRTPLHSSRDRKALIIFIATRQTHACLRPSFSAYQPTITLRNTMQAHKMRHNQS